MGRIVIIDDDRILAKLLGAEIRSLGHTVICAHTLKEGLDYVRENPVDLIFLDVFLPDGNGLDALGTIFKMPAAPEVIIITGEGDPDGAELAIRSGAWDYIAKPPSSIKDLVLPLTRALQYRNEKSRPSTVKLKRCGIVGNSRQIRACLETVASAAYGDANVLITGETGTGKELFAEAIHENSKRKNNNLVVVDCAALPENLVESMLFGHVKGAYTGADTSHTGLVKQADGGTLFLDEVGEMPLHIQRVFIRVLQERRFRPLGGNREIESDFRLVAATNRDLEEMVGKGGFREDLLFRIRSITFELPPLRERKGDAVELAAHYIRVICKRNGVQPKGMSTDFVEAVTNDRWPGNVRELIHAVETAVAVAGPEPTLFQRHLPADIRVRLAQKNLRNLKDKQEEQSLTLDAPRNLPTLQSVRESTIIRVEKQYLKDLMLLTDGDIKEACQISKLSRSRLYSLLQKYHIGRPEHP